jgi:hypothetical protein
VANDEKQAEKYSGAEVTQFMPLLSQKVSLKVGYIKFPLLRAQNCESFGKSCVILAALKIICLLFQSLFFKF